MYMLNTLRRILYAILYAYLYAGIISVLLLLFEKNHDGVTLPVRVMLDGPFTFIFGPMQFVSDHPILSIVWVVVVYAFESFYEKQRGLSPRKDNSWLWSWYIKDKLPPK